MKPMLLELFAFDDWASRAVFDAAAALSDAQLDQRFDIGHGSLRATLRHLYSADRIWYERIGAPDQASLQPGESLQTLPQLREAVERLSTLRHAWVCSEAAGDVEREAAFRDRAGNPWVRRCSDILLHAVNHGVYHRAQIVNMFRHLGAAARKPGVDYIIMKWKQPIGTPTPLCVRTIRRLFGYSDASRRALISTAAALPADQLDRPFEMGLGTLRRTLTHLYDAESWWEGNWTTPGGVPFPRGEEGVAMADLTARFDALAARRDAMLATMTDADLNRPVDVAPRPDFRHTFLLGVSMVQLCLHSTHHRAQANNMLRRLGHAPLPQDYILWCGQ